MTIAIVNENAKGDLGDPIAATDADGDGAAVHAYGGDDEDCFSIGDTSGQLSLNAERDFEND